MKLLLLLLSLPALAQAGVVCCWDHDCAACGGGAPGSDGQLVEKQVCMDGIFPSFQIWHPDSSVICMQTGNPILVDCCRKFNPGYVNDGSDPGCPGTFCACESCDQRMTMDECMANPEYTHVAWYYHKHTCRSIDSIIQGDPHVKTWSGKWFDYHGECDLVMMHVDQFEDLGPFSVHARTKIRADYSYISNAVLRIGDETLEVSSWGDYAINGVGGGIPVSRDAEATLGTIAGFKIQHSHPDDKQHTFRIVIGEDEVLEFATFKDLVSVRFSGGTADHFGKTHGLMGDFNGAHIARDGQTLIEDSNQFGQEWQVQPEEGMFFVTEPAPGKCRLPDAATEESRRLHKTVSKDAAEKACAKHQGAGFEACVLDVQLTGDVGIANAGGY